MKQRGTGLLEERLLGRPSSGGRPDFEHGSPRVRPLIDDGGSRHEGTNKLLVVPDVLREIRRLPTRSQDDS